MKHKYGQIKILPWVPISPNVDIKALTIKNMVPVYMALPPSQTWGF